MKKVLSLILAFAMVTGIMAGCSSTAGDESSQPPATTEPAGADSTEETTSYPVTIENNGITTTYESAPERIVAVEDPVAEILVALGLGDKVVALAPSMNTIDEVLPQYREEVSQIPMFPESGMNNGTPTLEAILAVEPDFVYGTSYTFYASNCGTPEDYAANGINIYATEGTYVESPTLENLYHDIENLGKIFDVRDRADELIAELRAREEAVREAVSDITDTKSVFVLDFDYGTGTYLTTGGATLEDYMISIAGGENVFGDLGEQYVDVSSEEIINRNAEFVIVTNYYTEDDGQTKVDGMKNSVDFESLAAVQEDNFLILSGVAVWPSLQSLDALEAIAQFLHPDAFAG